uniref:Protein HGH1 homolog n=1 Tax=Ascaris suum TaxID=6253 RepID=F1KYV4_ASCSU
MSGEDHQSAIFELVQFLEPRTRIDVRRSAIAYIIGVSAADEGPQLFKKEDFALGRALCLLFESTPEDRSPLLSALTNIASVDDVCANYIIEKSDVVTICVRSCRDRENIATFAAKLLSNLSLHFASKVFETAVKVWESFVSDIVALLNASDSGDFVDYMGYVLVNCTAMPRVRRLICERHLASILPMVTQNSSPNRRLIAVDIVRNLCFDDGNHTLLLDANDEFLSCLLKPLADASDDLTDDEIDALPIQLQYHDGQRCGDTLIIHKLVDALYQLCATKHGRSVLRAKGVYALLRELDKATSKRDGNAIQNGGMVLLDGAHSSLHALIGVLIRHESEMNVDPSLSSIRHLQQ